MQSTPKAFAGQRSKVFGNNLLLQPVSEEPFVSLGDAFSQRDRMPPAERANSGHVQKLARRAVRLRLVPNEFAVETNHVADQLGQLANGHVFAATDVDDFWRIVFLEQQKTGGGKTINVQKFPARLSCSPYDELFLISGFRFVCLAQERRQRV